MDFSVQEICEVFFNLEEKYNLNYWEVQGCFPWQLIRMYLYYKEFVLRCKVLFHYQGTIKKMQGP